MCNKECPNCRIRIPTYRSLQPDHRCGKLIDALNDIRSQMEDEAQSLYVSAGKRKSDEISLGAECTSATALSGAKRLKQVQKNSNDTSSYVMERCSSNPSDGASAASHAKELATLRRQVIGLRSAITRSKNKFDKLNTTLLRTKGALSKAKAEKRGIEKMISQLEADHETSMQAEVKKNVSLQGQLDDQLENSVAIRRCNGALEVELEREKEKRKVNRKELKAKKEELNTTKAELDLSAVCLESRVEESRQLKAYLDQNDVEKRTLKSDKERLTESRRMEVKYSIDRENVLLSERVSYLNQILELENHVKHLRRESGIPQNDNMRIEAKLGAELEKTRRDLVLAISQHKEVLKERTLDSESIEMGIGGVLAQGRQIFAADWMSWEFLLIFFQILPVSGTFAFLAGLCYVVVATSIEHLVSPIGDSMPNNG